MSLIFHGGDNRLGQPVDCTGAMPFNGASITAAVVRDERLNSWKPDLFWISSSSAWWVSARRRSLASCGVIGSLSGGIPSCGLRRADLILLLPSVDSVPKNQNIAERWRLTVVQLQSCFARSFFINSAVQLEALQLRLIRLNFFCQTTATAPPNK